MQNKLKFVPFKELKKKKDNSQAILNKYWLSHPDNGAAFYHNNGRVTAQYNDSREVSEILLKRCYPDSDLQIVFVGQAYIEPSR